MSPSSALLDQAARPLYWLMFAGAVWILLRGHNEPGGGFIGGLVAVAGSSMLASLLGTQRARLYQWLPPLSMALVGVGLALLSGLAGPLAGRPFLTHLWSGSVSTVLLFDLGVFLAVWGGLTGYIYALLDGPGKSEP